MGLSFKEDCPDIRNTKIIDIINDLNEYNCKVSVYDPWVDSNAAKQEYGINLIKNIKKLSQKLMIKIFFILKRKFQMKIMKR